MKVQRKLQMRRNELANIEPSAGQDCLVVGVVYAFDELSPSWLAMYNYCIGAAGILSKRLGNLEETELGRAITLADKFLGKDNVEVQAGKQNESI